MFQVCTHRRYGVESAGVERVTFQQSSYSERSSAKHAVKSDGLAGVAGAAGMEATVGAQKWRHSQLIKPNSG